MDLKGADVVNYKKICTEIGKEERPLKMKIPFYQRPYSWEEEHISSLIDDFFNNIKNNQNENEGYFAGSIVTVYKKEEKFHELVDGQQRMTTIFLTNFIKFLLLKRYVYILIKKKSISLSLFLDKLEFSFLNVFLAKENFIINLKEEILDKLESYTDEDELEEIADKYARKIGLETLINENNFKENARRKMQEFMNERELTLEYSRKVYNQNLKKALSLCQITIGEQLSPEIIFLDNENNEVIENYLVALNTIFKKFNFFDTKDSPTKIGKKIIDKIDEFLDNLEFCVIQTGNTNDAYTLFEVLNDRGLALTPLDLIKNMYYKIYCEKNRSLSEVEIDNKIQRIENLWGNEIFDNNSRVYDKNLIIFFGTVFLTGNFNLKYNDNKNYREPLENEFQLNKDANIDYHVMIFHLMRILIKEFEIPFNNKNNKVLEIENELTHSIISKTIYLTNALGQRGIMAGLMNVILKTFLDRKTSYQNYKEDFKNYLKKLKSNENYDNYSNVYKVAQNIYKLSLLGKSYKLSKEYSDIVIRECQSKEVFYPSRIEINSRLLEKMKIEYLKWIREWKKGKNDLKIKIFFMNLMKTEKIDNELITKEMKSISQNGNSLQLDHFEPEKIQKDSKEKYFSTKDNFEKREDYVNSLGNFMLLDAKNNNKKNNSPTMRSKKYFENMGIADHWLIKEMYKLHEENSEGLVPTQDFFNKRKKSLINYFYSVFRGEILKIDGNDFKVKIEDIF